MVEPTNNTGPAPVPFQMPIERGKIREFATATKATSAEYFNDPNTVSPPTMLITSTLWAPPESSALSVGIELDNARVLHGGQEFVFHGPPPRAGTTLTAQSRVDKIYTKDGKRGGTMTFIEIVIDFRDETGTLVAETRSTVIETAKPPTTANTQSEQ